MKINNTTLLVGLAGIGAIAYFYFKNKKDSTKTTKEVYNDGKGMDVDEIVIPISQPSTNNKSNNIGSKPYRRDKFGMPRTDSLRYPKFGINNDMTRAKSSIYTRFGINNEVD